MVSRQDGSHQAALEFDLAPAGAVAPDQPWRGLVGDWPVTADWQPTVSNFWASPVGQRLKAHLVARKAAGVVVFPAEPRRALAVTSLHSVKVVILGQDPYPGVGQAEGLAFSVPPGVRAPPSLRNIFKELSRDLGSPIPAGGSLLSWAQQGVLLLNTSLTVEEGLAGSHAKCGWEVLTDALIAKVAAHASPCVYLLWGAHAQAKAALIEQTARAHNREALVLQANHPSPLSALRRPVPFIGCGHFGTAQRWLHAHGQAIDWTLEQS